MRLLVIAVAALASFVALAAEAKAGEVHVRGDRIVYRGLEREDDYVVVLRRANGYELIDGNSTVDAAYGCARLGRGRAFCPGDRLTSVYALLGEGDDAIDLRNSGLSGHIYGGTGQDTLVGGDAADRFVGGDGNDTLLGFGGKDSLIGGHGDDDLDGGRGADVVGGGRGADILDGGRGTDVVSGGGGEDKLTGGREADHLLGGASGDTLLGFDGDDRLDGGPGNDRLDGGEGDDSLQGAPGNDHADASLGSDSFSGGTGRDTASYESRVRSVAVVADLQANDGEADEGDNVEPDVETLVGGQAADILVAAPSGSFLQGRRGDDRLEGGEGRDYLDGGTGADYIAAAGGDDYVYSPESDETDAVDCGAGNDGAQVHTRDEPIESCEALEVLSHWTPPLGEILVPARAVVSNIRLFRIGSRGAVVEFRVATGHVRQVSVRIVLRTASGRSVRRLRRRVASNRLVRVRTRAPASVQTARIAIDY